MSDLTTPLGFKTPSEEGGRRPVGVVLAACVVTVAALLVLWLVIVDDPLGGEPRAVAKIEDAEHAVSRSDITTVGVKSGSGQLLPPVDGAGAQATDADEDEIAAVGTPGSGGVAVRETDGDLADVKLPVVADAALVQDGPYGPLPKVAEDGRTPLQAYARPVPGFVGAAPKVVIVVGGLGLSQTGTEEALRQLPAPVTLAFAPYGASLDRWTARARQDGHELLLQLPMEPFDYPDNDPGPHTLLTSLDADKNVDRLHWLMARTSVYVGVMNYMGGRFTAEGPALSPVLDEVAHRGLLYLDDGSSSRSVAGEVAKKQAVPFSRADIVIDQVATEAEIIGRLAQLEQIARTRGIAVGVASALPISVRKIAEWAKTLDPRGITLVPVSASQRKG